ncbi:MAG: hydrogenase nickel incorporation protein HypB [Planctomycetes bacterium]|nr:hydrogenase nickel incorporation protein HypB [Planctomycetota bacterium]
MLTTEARQKILAENEAAAAELRERFARAGTLVVDLISSPGSGKTALLEATARKLAGSLRIACIVGDIATERDADRLRAAGLPSRQITTGGACHLEARNVRDALAAARFGPLDILFIENVGNLVCPASFALGEDFKIVLLSVTEGHDKPFKYPGIFSRASVALITKSDLLPYVAFDVERVRGEITTLRPNARVLLTSVVDEKGLESWCDLLRSALGEKRGVVATA